MKYPDKVFRCPDTVPYGCLATTGPNGPWASPVYFARNEITLYFMSQMNTQHMQNILKNTQISFAVYDTSQDTLEDVIGLQIEGTGRILNSQKDIEQAFACYFFRVYPNKKPTYREKIDNPYAHNPAWHFVEITPQKIWLFDSAQFGEDRVLVFERAKT